MPLKKLNVPDEATPAELIRAIEKKDKRFRLFQTIFMVGTFVLLTFVISAQQQTLDSVRAQIDEDKRISEQTRKERTEQLGAITRRLNCMVVFFSTEDRDNLTIENVNKCTLNRNEELNKFFQNEPNNSSENPPNLPGSGPTVTQENAEPQATPPRNDPNGADDSQNGDDDNQIEQRPPVTIETPLVDIPLCVPITQLCVR